MVEIETDICVIGAGSGGLSVAAAASMMGAPTVLIEAAKMGGDCLNTGCVPSKSLLAAYSVCLCRRFQGNSSGDVQRWLLALERCCSSGRGLTSNSKEASTEQAGDLGRVVCC